MLATMALGAAAAIAATCGAAPVPSTSPAPTVAMDSVQVFYARADADPIGVSVFVPSNASVEARLRARFDALITGPGFGPSGSFNLFSGATARIAGISTESDLAVLDFAVTTDDWGLGDALDVRAFLQQVVFTATDESSIYKVLLTRDEGQPAVIAVSDMIATYHAPLTRELVAPYAHPDHSVVYFARDGQLPVAVFLPGAGIGATAEARIRSRLVALETGPGVVMPDAYNTVRDAKAKLDRVEVAGDLVTIDYLVRDDHWGVDGSTRLASFVQQLVYTASEEPGIVRVLITQNGGATAIIGGEGLVIDHPATRADVNGHP
ncbi:MAG TPA: GerMN domain-containing protein [Candidatus Limnocylindria bacterium]|jgi:spore germination protein GerM